MTAVVVETGAGLANADAYISVAQATAYHNDRGNEDAWDAIDDKDAALRLATAYLEQVYRLRWAGTRATVAQALSWPRYEVPIPDSPFAYAGAAYVPFNSVPVEVARACAELALLTVSGPLAPNVERRTMSETVGPISVTYDGSSPVNTQYTSVDRLLAPYLQGGGPSVPLRRT